MSSTIPTSVAADHQYWADAFAGWRTATIVPGDRAGTERAPTETPVAWAPATGERLAQIAGQSAYGFLIICAGLAGAWLERCLATDEVTLITPILDRRFTAEDYVNTLLPIRLDTAELTTLKDAVAAASRVLAGAQEHQNLPFETLLHRIAPGADGCRSLSSVGLAVTELQRPEFLDQVGIDLALVVDVASRSAVLRYDSARYSAEYASLLAGRFALLADLAAGDPTADLTHADLLTDQQRRILDVLNRTSDPTIPPTDTIVDMFATAASRCPQQTAVFDGDRTTSYQELDRAADALARRIVEARGGDVGPFRTAVLLDRSTEMIVALLAVLKAGGAYVPIDRSYPAQRIAHLLADSAAAVLVSDGPAPCPFSGAVVSPHEQGDPGTSLPKVSADDLAYVVYTSGSTGLPKGVMIRHRSIANTLAWRRAYQDFGPWDVNLQIPSFSFDSAVEDIFTPLVSGAGLVLLDPERHADVDHVAALLVERAVTTILITPGLYGVLLQTRPDALTRLRVVTVAGEGFGTELVRAHFAAAPGARLVNEYGPTENSVCSTVRELHPTDPEVLIGRPISNTRCYVLDDRERLCPPGVAGQIAVAGRGLMVGYHGQPDLTRERLHLVDAVGEDVYLTGDRGVITASGDLRFLGRADNQVKLRGFRIELGEIEGALLAVEGILATAVVARPDAAGQLTLCQYVVATEPWTEAELRSCLAAKLPSHMVPARFVQLDALPMTPHGKVDTARLPPPTEQSAVGYAAPRTPTEEMLAGLWCEILDVPRVGVHDDFFELGGQSLRATLLSSRVRGLAGKDVAVKAVFAHPTIAELAAHVDALPATVRSRIPRAAPAAAYRASDEQKRIYLMCAFDGIGLTYNVPLRVDLPRALDPARFEDALRAVYARQSALRTVFRLEDGELWQHIRADDLPEYQHVETDESGLAEIVAGFVRPFDLARGPLFRCTLVTCAGRSVLLLDTHHIVADGVSAGCLLADLSAAYEGTALPPLAARYHDYSEWAFTRDDATSRDFWAQTLAEYPTEVAVPLDHPRPGTQTFAGDKVRLHLDAEATERLTAYAHGQRVTLFSVLLSAYALLLGRHSGQEDVVVGTPVAGRTADELRHTVGMFINMLPLRARPAAGQTLGAYVADVHRCGLEAFAHQDLQFNKLVELADAVRTGESSPLLQFVFVMQNMDLLADGFDGQPLTVSDLFTPVAKFDCTLLAHERAGGLDLVVEYRTDLFERATIERLADQLAALLRRLPGLHDEPLERIGLVGEAEFQRLLSFNDTTVELPEHPTVLDAIRRHPADAPALADTCHRLSYGELDRLTDTVARRLVTAGVRPGDVVAVGFDARVESVVAALGAQKAGAAYLPLDLECPDARLVQIMTDSDARALLHRGDTSPAWLPAGVPELHLDLDVPAEPGPAELPPAPGRDDLAYVIYTSGSTGTPKGVEVEHVGLLNLCAWFTRHFELTPADKVGKYAGAGFDAGVWEVFPALYAGAELHFVPDEARYDVFRLDAFYRERGVTVAWLPTQVCEQYMDIADSPLRLLTTGGDKLSRYVPRGYRMVNNYGPTETTVCTTSFDVTAPQENLPIGRPIANTQVFVLDAHGLVVPVGVFGELCVSGVSLARGYRGRPDLTAERFVENPYLPGQRLYRTGDRARWLPDGVLEFGGRTDRQVKIRGHRIELDEIKHVLLACPGVREAVVVCLDRGGRYRETLAGFYTVQPGQRVDPAILWSTLNSTLPPWMVPASLTELATIPLTRNDKVDVAALAASRPAGEVREAVAPASERERCVLEIWHEVLGSTEAGVDDSFFDVGGNSLLLMKVAARLREYAGVDDLQVTSLFQYPTVRAMVRLLDDLGSERDEDVFAGVRARNRRRQGGEG